MPTFVKKDKRGAVRNIETQKRYFKIPAKEKGGMTEIIRLYLHPEVIDWCCEAFPEKSRMLSVKSCLLRTYEMRLDKKGD